MVQGKATHPPAVQRQDESTVASLEECGLEATGHELRVESCVVWCQVSLKILA